MPNSRKPVHSKQDPVQSEVNKQIKFKKKRYVLYTGWINKKVLLYSTGNYIQYPVINIMDKNIKKNKYIRISESLYCIVEMNTTL